MTDLNHRIVRPESVNLRQLTLEMARAHFKEFGSRMPIRICACDNRADVDGVKLMAFDADRIHSSEELAGEVYLDGTLVRLRKTPGADEYTETSRHVRWLQEGVPLPRDATGSVVYALGAKGLRPFYTEEGVKPMRLLIENGGSNNLVGSSTVDYYVCASDWRDDAPKPASRKCTIKQVGGKFKFSSARGARAPASKRVKK